MTIEGELSADDTPEGTLLVRNASVSGLSVSLLSDPAGDVLAHLHLLDRYVDVEIHGALVAVPSRYTVAMYPIRGLDAVRAIERLRDYAQRSYRDSSDPVSPHVYWWRGTEVTRIDTEVEGARLRVKPPRAFSRLLVSLATEQ